MLSLPPSVRIFLCTQPTDMRRSFDGLAALTREVLQQEVLSGHLFVFFNRRRDRTKILYWDRSGLALWAKRLERGVFTLPVARDPGMSLSAAELTLILEGIDLNGAKRQKRYVSPQSA
jgi:transposase